MNPPALSGLHQVLDLLRSGELRALRRSGEDLHLTLLLPEVAGRIRRGSRSLTLVLVRCTRLALLPWAPGQAPVEDLKRLEAMRLQLLGVRMPPGEAPYAYALVQNPKAEPTLHGGRLAIEAEGWSLADEAGAPVSLDTLTRHAAEATAEVLRTQSVGGYKKVLEAVWARDVVPLMESQGFQVQGRALIQLEPPLGKFLGLEVLRFSTALSLSFQLDVGLFVGDLAGEKKVTEKVLLTKAFPAYSTRAGALWGHEQETYVLSGPPAPAALGERLREDLLRHVLPFFQRFHTVEDVVAFLDAENRRTGSKRFSFAIANVLARAGRKEESRAYFRESEGDAQAILRVARSYGVEP